jgi:uncharacterized membrane protein (DUF441 family)
MVSIVDEKINKKELPNSTGVLVLGILSIVFCCCYGIIGLTFGIIALYLSKQGIELYEVNPSLYTSVSYNNLKAGRVCAIIGIVLSSFGSVAFLISLLVDGSNYLNKFKEFLTI